MKKILIPLIQLLKDFILNPFWKTWPVLAIIVLSLAINALLWYLFKTRIKINPMPFMFASGLIILNLVLANFLFNREKLASYILILVGLFTQILMLVFIRYLVMVF